MPQQCPFTEMSKQDPTRANIEMEKNEDKGGAYKQSARAQQDAQQSLLGKSEE